MANLRIVENPVPRGQRTAHCQLVADPRASCYRDPTLSAETMFRAFTAAGLCAGRHTGAPLKADQPLSAIRSADLHDLDQIMEIEEACFPSPWPRTIFIDELQRESSYLKVIALEPDDLVIAFINYWVVHDEIHVLNVATHPSWRRQHLAHRLLQHVRRAAQVRDARLIVLEVRTSNEAAIRLYESFGFRPIGLRPRYYENNEDAIVMELRLRE